MTGTLFVNEPRDIEAIVSLGNFKRPMTKNEWDEMLINSVDNPRYFTNYFEGLISYYKLDLANNSDMPRVKYNFIPVEYDKPDTLRGNEKRAYSMLARNRGKEEKAKFVISFIKSKPNEKTLIYSEVSN